MVACAHSFPLEREHCRCYSASYDTDTALIRTRRPAKAFAAVTPTDLGRQVLSSSPWNAEFLLPRADLTATSRHMRHLHTCGEKMLYVPSSLSPCLSYPCALMPADGEQAFTLQRYVTPSGRHRYSCGTLRKSSFQSRL